MQLLDIIPSEVLELILDKVDIKDLRNCSLAHQRLDAAIRKEKCLYLIEQVLPFIVPKLELKDVMKIPHVCHDWRKSSYQFENNVPGRLPYKKESYFKGMSTYKRDLAEVRSRKESWFLLFKCIPPDIRTFRKEIAALSGVPPSLHFGRSAHFIIHSRTWQVRDIYLDKLHDFLHEFGDRLWYIKLTVSEAVSNDLTNRDEDAFTRLFWLFSLIPNIRGLDLDLDFDISLRSMSPVLLFPTLSQLDSISFRFHTQRDMITLQKQVVSKYASQLKKLKIDNLPHTLASEMPTLTELHISEIQSSEIFENLKELKAPLQKLTLDFGIYSKYDTSTILKCATHFSLEQLILRWKVPFWGFIKKPKSEEKPPVNCSFSSDKFKDLQFPNLHTLTLENCAQPWCPLMGCFPSLEYFNICHNITGTTEQVIEEKNIIWQKERPHIRKLKGKVDPTGTTTEPVCETNFGAFPKLRQVTRKTKVEYLKVPNKNAPRTRSRVLPPPALNSSH